MYSNCGSIIEKKRRKEINKNKNDNDNQPHSIYKYLVKLQDEQLMKK